MLPTNYTVNIVMLNYPPFGYNCSTLYRTDACEYPGSAYEVTQKLLSSINVPYSLIEPTAHEKDTFGMAASVLNLLEQDDHTCSISAFALTPPRLARYAYSAVVQYDAMAALCLDGGGDDQWHTWMNFTKVFAPKTWLIVTLALVAFIAVDYLYSKIAHKRLTAKAQSCLVLTAFFIALAGAIYESGLLSYLLLSPTKALFTDYASFASVVADGKPTLLQLKGTAPLNILKRRLSLSLQNVELAITTEEYVKKLLTGRYITVSHEMVLHSYAAMDARVRVVALPELGTQSGGMLCSKNIDQQFLLAINQSIIENGDFYACYRDRYMKRMRFQQKQMKKTTQMNSDFEKLNVEKTMGIFLLLLAGCVGGLTCFLGELMITTRPMKNAIRHEKRKYV